MNKFHVVFDRKKDEAMIKTRDLWRFEEEKVDISNEDFSTKREFLKLVGGENTQYPLELFCKVEHFIRRDIFINYLPNIEMIVNDISDAPEVSEIDVDKLKRFHDKMYNTKKRNTMLYDENMIDIYNFFNYMIYIVNYGNKSCIEKMINLCKLIDVKSKKEMRMFQECFRLISVAFDDCGQDTNCSVALIPFIENENHVDGKCDLEILLVETFFGNTLKQRGMNTTTMLSGYGSKTEYDAYLREYDMYRGRVNWAPLFMNTVKKEMYEETSAVIEENQVIPLMIKKLRYSGFSKDVFVYGVKLTKKNLEEIRSRAMICEETTRISAVTPEHFVHKTNRSGWRDDTGFRKNVAEELYKKVYLPNVW